MARKAGYGWRDPRLPFLLLGMVVALAAIAGAAAWWWRPPAPLTYRGLPQQAGPLPPLPLADLPGETAAAGPPSLAPQGRVDPLAPPADPLAALAAPGPYGLLPRIAPDGRRPFDAYRRKPAETGRGPRIALVVRGLGLARRPTVAAMGLVPDVALAFSPYAPAVAAWLREARRLGHEVLLELPLANGRSGVDPGPLALVPGDELALQRLLARGPGIFALLLDPPEVARPGLEQPVAALSRAGLGLIASRPAPALAPLARRHRVPYGAAAVVLDAEADPMAVDFALGRLEAVAEREGGAIGITGPLPLVFERLAQWLPGLAPRGFLLVPPSQILAEGTDSRP